MIPVSSGTPVIVLVTESSFKPLGNVLEIIFTSLALATSNTIGVIDWLCSKLPKLPEDVIQIGFTVIFYAT